MGDTWASSRDGPRTAWNLPINRERMSRTAGSGDPKDSARLFSKGAAIFLVGGNVSSRWFSKFDWFTTYVRTSGSYIQSAPWAHAAVFKGPVDERLLSLNSAKSCDPPSTPRPALVVPLTAFYWCCFPIMCLKARPVGQTVTQESLAEDNGWVKGATVWPPRGTTWTQTHSFTILSSFQRWAHDILATRTMF